MWAPPDAKVVLLARLALTLAAMVATRASNREALALLRATALSAEGHLIARATRARHSARALMWAPPDAKVVLFARPALTLAAMVATRASNREALALLSKGALSAEGHLIARATWSSQSAAALMWAPPGAKVVLLECLALALTARVAFGADASIPVALPTD